MTTRREFLSQTALGAAAFASAAPPTSALLERARTLLDKAPLIDTHNDLPSMFLELNGGDVSKFNLGERQPTLCADVPALREGRVGAQYWSIFVESATQKTHVSMHEALREFDAALNIIASQKDFEQARTADDIERIRRGGRIACLMGVEGGHMIENSPAALRVFHALGARYLTLTHWDDIDWADAATDRPEHFGLTDLGRQLVREMNRLGMFADLSHVSADTMRDALRATRAPVIFSHSGAFALNPHPRNVPDDVLAMLRDNGGVIHVNFIRPFISRDGFAWTQKGEAMQRELHTRGLDEAAIKKAGEEWEKAAPPSATIADVADHIDHIRQVAGIDAIGIGADFYDVKEETMVTGLGNVTRYPFLFAELLRRGYSDEDVMKIAGRNHLRAMRRMEKVAAELQRTETPLVTEPKVVRLALLALLLAPLFARAGAATTLHVGKSPETAQYVSVQAAVDALPDAGGTVEIAQGTYREKLVIGKPNVKLIGRGRKPDAVVLVWGDSHISAGGTGKSASVWASGDGFEAHNLTIQNDYQVNNTEKSQAVALRLTADRAVLTNVRLLGAQDTLYAASKSPDSPSRQYFRDCYIEGHVDFIFGDAKAFFDRCHIHGIANEIVMITAQSKVKPEQDSAYVFDRCRITADAGVQELWLGRAWRPYATVVFLHTRIDAPLQPAGWREWTPGTTETFKTATYREYQSTGQGASIPTREPSSKQLTKTEAQAWSRRKFLAGADGWRP